MIKLEKMSVKFPELDLIAEWRNQSMISLRSSDLTAKGQAQADWVNSFTDREKYYFIYGPKPCTNAPRVFLGYCGLDKIDPVNRTAEIGLLINPNQHKKGFGSEAVKQLLNLAFNNFNLNCVFAEVIDSTQNWIFWKKQGFILEGSLRQRHFKNGVYKDSIVASITRNDWEEQLLSEVP